TTHARTQGFSLIELVIALGVFLIVVSLIVSAFVNGLKTIRWENGLAERDAEVQRAFALMAIEISQAGVTPETLDLTNSATSISYSGTLPKNSTTITLTNTNNNATRGLYPGRPLILGLPETDTTVSETINIATVTNGCSSCVTLQNGTGIVHP